MHFSKTDCVYMPDQLNLWHWTDSVFLENMSRFLDRVDHSELPGHFAQMVTLFCSQELWDHKYLLCGGPWKERARDKFHLLRCHCSEVVLAFKGKSWHLVTTYYMPVILLPKEMSLWETARSELPFPGQWLSTCIHNGGFNKPCPQIALASDLTKTRPLSLHPSRETWQFCESE